MHMCESTEYSLAALTWTSEVSGGDEARPWQKSNGHIMPLKKVMRALDIEDAVDRVVTNKPKLRWKHILSQPYLTRKSSPLQSRQTVVLQKLHTLDRAGTNIRGRAQNNQALNHESCYHCR
eukprot:GHVU01058934.1.p1 GENE.GHVU01058934.1~~GHVU01058934.1.p1  ORF type:complete len:121 (-),score=3.72 GHVU01058934.1:494-856(-)